jgi:hypothetical protein
MYNKYLLVPQTSMVDAQHIQRSGIEVDMSIRRILTSHDHYSQCLIHRPLLVRSSAGCQATESLALMLTHAATYEISVIVERAVTGTLARHCGLLKSLLLDLRELGMRPGSCSRMYEAYSALRAPTLAKSNGIQH